MMRNMMQGLTQLVLDLFEPAPQTVKTKRARPKLAKPQQELVDSIDQVEYRHPGANREARLGNALVAYEFKRGKRRSIGFVVGDEGLQVRAPKWVPLYEVDAAVRERGDWIVSKLGEARQRHEQRLATRIEWREGSTFPFLGESVIVVLDPRLAVPAPRGEPKLNAQLHTDEAASNLTLEGVPRMTLHIGLPHDAAPEQIREAVQAWLLRQAKRVFTERLDHFAPRLNVHWKKLALSSAGTRWGSASVDGSIWLNWRLIHFKQSVIDYVVAHELSHLRVMDHSPRFWDTVGSVVPDFRELRSRLRDEAIPLWH
jgi:predicted metal-dependent hydrolase